MQPVTEAVTAAKLNQYLRMQQAGFKVYYGPLFSAVDWAGIARGDNAGTHQANAQTAGYFQASVGQQGQGFVAPRTLRYTETNLDGAPGQLPGGYSFVGHACGVYIMPQTPPTVKDQFTRHMSISSVRHSNVWEMGGIQFWPEASFGHQSCAVSTTVANSLFEYGVNGATGSRAFPEGGELYYPAKEVIKFNVTLHEPTFVTVNGLTFDGAFFPAGNGIPQLFGALVFVTMEGFRFEKLNA